MKVKIIYFSGTGNTKAVADLYSQLLKRKGHDVSCSSIEENPVVDDCDLIVIGGPIYAGNMPDELLNWVRKNIPKTDTSKAIVYSTSAVLMNANGVKSVCKKLKKKGYQIIDQLILQMPRNFYVDKYDPTPLDEQEIQFENMINQVETSVRNLNLEVNLEMNESTIGIDFLADIFRIMAKRMGKQFKINDGCTNCGLCEKNCPKSNINLSNKEYLNKCILCTRCIHNCPVNAITYKGKTIEQYKVLKVNL
ncbi:MAG: EFR1 family ferrodoxin [Acidaminobacteraceae bacterium]